jgi:hypothetical protein
MMRATGSFEATTSGLGGKAGHSSVPILRWRKAAVVGRLSQPLKPPFTRMRLGASGRLEASSTKPMVSGAMLPSASNRLSA